MRRPGTSKAAPLALLLGAVLTAGCAGPDRPLSVGVKEVPSNVVLGAQSSPSAAPPGVGAAPTTGLPVIRVLPPPSVVTLPPPPFAVRDPARPEPPPPPAPPAEPTCPLADPLRAPALEAPATITARPAAAQYVFRNVGTFEQSGADAQKGAFPATSLRTVSGALEGADGFVYDVTETLGDVTTTTSYRVVDRQPLGSPLPPGLYVARVESRGGDGQTAVFEPTPQLRLATFPLLRGARVESRGVDPVTATAMSFVSTVTGKARVDACGEPLDSFVLDLTDGRLVSPTQDVDFTATYWVGTQFGGLLLKETVAFAGEVDGAGVSRTNTSTIAQVPRAAGGPQP